MTPGCTKREVRMWDEKEAYAGCIHKPITTVDNYVYFYWRLLKDGMQTIIPFMGLSLKYVSSCVISLVSKAAGYTSSNPHTLFAESHSLAFQGERRAQAGVCNKTPTGGMCGNGDCQGIWEQHWHLLLHPWWFLMGFSPLWLSAVHLILPSFIVLDAVLLFAPSRRTSIFLNGLLVLK